MATRKKATSSEVILQPSTRVFTTWTPKAIRSAEISADSGNIRQAANLTEWVLQDDRVQGALGARIDALLGLDPSFEASGDKRRSNKAVKALEGGEDWWDSFPEAEVGLILRWGIVLGFAPARHAWELVEGHDGRILPCPEFWHPQHTRFDWPSRKWFTWAQGENTTAGASQEFELVPGDGDWLMHRPYGKLRPWAWGLWHALAPLVLLKHLAREDRARAGEKGALLVGTFDSENDLKDEAGTPAAQIRLQLAEEIKRRGRDGVCFLPPGFDLKLVQVAAGSNELYESQIKMANDAIAINIRGGNLTTEVSKGGSLAATEAQERTGDQGKLRFDAQAWTTTAHNDSLKPWAERNFGDRMLAPWPVYPVEPKKNKKAEADTANGALDAAKKATDLGFKLNRKGFIDEFEMDEWLEPGADVPPPVPGAPAPASPSPASAVPSPTGATGPSPETPPAPPAPQAARHVHGRTLLASGDKLKSGRGFAEGQLYTDALAENATEAGINALKPTLDAVLEELDAATDYDDLRERLRARYENLDPEELNDIVYSAMALGELAGRVATNQDAKT
jgi:phage gp29-like protein